ncbi:hypothetical protein EV2_007582 [Malus domestica]
MTPKQKYLISPGIALEYSSPTVVVLPKKLPHLPEEQIKASENDTLQHVETTCRRNKQRRMQSAQSTQHKESELRNSRSCHICLKKQAEKNAACTVNSAEGALWAARADSPPLNQILKDQVTNWKKSPSILKIIPLTKLLRCELERLNKATSRHLHLVPACHVFESTFKNQALTALEEAFNQIQDQASTALEEITRIQKIFQPSSRSKLWKVNKAQKQIRADSSTTKAKDHLPHEAPCGPISTFKIKPRRPLKKFQTKVQEQALNGP